MNAPSELHLQNSITIWMVSSLRRITTQSSSLLQITALYWTVNREVHRSNNSLSDRIVSSFAISFTFLTATYSLASLSNALNTSPNALCLMGVIYSAPFSDLFLNFVVLNAWSIHEDNCKGWRITVQKWRRLWFVGCFPFKQVKWMVCDVFSHLFQ